MGIIKEKRLNDLTEKLIDSILNDDSDFFDTKEILFPTRPLQSYVKAQFLKEHNEILMNVKFDTLKNGILSLFDVKNKLADASQMTLIILDYLANNKINDEVLNGYVSDNETVLSGVKMYDVASNLASLFIDYENDCKIDNLTKWQKEIYDNVIKKLNENKLDTLYNIFITNKFKEDKNLTIFGVVKYSKLEEVILNKYKENHEVEEYILEVDEKYCDKEINIKKAPSKLREIEYIHSEICKLILEEKARYSDFLVVGNSLDEYETAISRVFKQEGDFPNIPYYINANKKKDNEVLNGLRRIKDIVDKGYFSRLDFINLAHNKVIQKVRSISDDDVDYFKEAIISTNVYRGVGENVDEYRIDDWVYLKNRLLTSKLSDLTGDVNVDQLSFDDRSYIPYKLIGLDDVVIVKLISLIDDIVDIMFIYDDLIKKGQNYFISDVINFKRALDKFFSIKEDDEIEVCVHYKKAANLLDFIIEKSFTKIPFNSILYLLISVSETSSRNIGELYSSGISFASFDPRAIYSAKYIFFINAGSSVLPMKKTKNTFDTSDELISYEDEENAFKLYYQNAEKFYVTYIYKDLKTDEEFYLSNFVKNIFKLQGKEHKEEHDEAISIDEDRPWDELFTSKEFKNKQFRDDLTKDESKQLEFSKEKEDLGKQNIDTVIKISSMAKFLNEPLEYKASRLFGFNDESDGKLKNQFEPFELNPLDGSKLFKKIVKKIWNYPEIIKIAMCHDSSIYDENDNFYNEKDSKELVESALKLLSRLDLSNYRRENLLEKYNNIVQEQIENFDKNSPNKKIIEYKNDELNIHLCLQELIDFDDSIIEKGGVKLTPEILFNFNKMVLNEFKYDLIEELNFKKLIPDVHNSINFNSFNEVYNNVRNLFKVLKDNKDDFKDIEFLKLPDFNLNIKDIDNIENIDFKIVNDNEFFRLTSKDNKITYFACKKDGGKNKDLLEIYIISLIDLLISNNMETTIMLYNSKLNVDDFIVDAEEAKELLSNICKAMLNYKDNKFLDFQIIIDGKKLNSLNEIINKMGVEHGYWSYFDERKLFDYSKELGYTYENFENEIDDMIDKQKELVKFYKEKEAQNNE